MVQEHEISITVPSGGHVYGVLTFPQNSPGNVTKATPGTRLVLIAHGFGGHKDYCYQRQLGQDLADKRGMFSFRFDFRGCGKSSPVVDAKLGRTIRGSDMEDLDAIVQELVTTRGFVLAGVVGHSRGSVAMFYWALKQHAQGKPVPTLVNVSGRYDAAGFLDRVRHFHGNVEERGMDTTINTEGEYKKVNIPWNELKDVGDIDLSAINKLPKDVHVLSIYGLKDHIVPLEDADRFAAKLKPRHTLRLVAHADHNFYQFVEEDSTRVNHNPAVVDLIVDWFEPDAERERFMETHQYAGVVSRWKNVEGIHNFRDFGGFKTEDGKTVRPGLLFRCANPARVTPEGAATMCNLGIKTVFDLRSEQELQRAGVAPPIGGIENKWTPVFRDRDLSPAVLAERTKMFSDPLEGYQRAYRELLDKAPDSYRKIMEHILHRPNDGFVVHCTAGKDRTGVICALILLLMKVDADTIAREYELTTSGLAQEFPAILKAVEKDNTGMSEQAKLTLLGSRYESMRGTLDIVNTEYGGAWEYFKQYCGFSDDELTTIVKNLTADGAIGWRWMI